MTVKTQFKTDIVKRYKNGESSYQISKNEGCSYNAILRELKRRGINTGLRYWAKEEIEKLKELYPVTPNEELLKEFPNRKKKAIGGMARKLGLKKKECKRVCRRCGKEFVTKNIRKRELCLKCIKKQWDRNNPHKAIKRRKRWLQRNPEYLRQYWKRPEIRKRVSEYLKQLRKENPKFRLDQDMANYIRQSLEGKKAGRRWERLVGYTIEDLIKHLENQFDEKMNLGNYGSYWHVDHIRPKSLFRYTSPDDPKFKKCWALENLQPLEKIANLRKSNIFSPKPSYIKRGK